MPNTHSSTSGHDTSDWVHFTMINWNVDYILSGGLAAHFTSMNLQLLDFPWTSESRHGMLTRFFLNKFLIFSTRPVPATSETVIGESGTAINDLAALEEEPKFHVQEPFFNRVAEIPRQLWDAIGQGDPRTYRATYDPEELEMWPGFHELTGGGKNISNVSELSAWSNATEDNDYWSYDAIYTLALAMKHVGNNSADLLAWFADPTQRHNVKFDGATGKVEFDATTGDRIANIEILIWRPGGPRVAFHQPGQDIEIYDFKWFTQGHFATDSATYVAGTNVTANLGITVPDIKTSDCHPAGDLHSSGPWNTNYHWETCYQEFCHFWMHWDQEKQHCVYCDVGKSTQGEMKKKECTDCPRGKVGAMTFRHSGDLFYIGAPDVRNDDCLECPPGKFSYAGALQCLDCPVGRFSNSSAAPDCTPCPLGTYQDQEGTTVDTCKACPGSSNTQQEGSASISDCQCPENTYMACLKGDGRDEENCATAADSKDKSEGICSPCPTSGLLEVAYDCPGYFEDVNGVQMQAPPHLRPGFYADAKDPYIAYTCWVAKEHCRGGPVGFGNLDPSKQCGGDRTGMLCGLCKEGYRFDDGVCRDCTELTGRGSGTVGLLVLFLFFAFIATLTTGLVVLLDKEDSIWRFVITNLWLVFIYLQTWASWGTVVAQHQPSMSGMFKGLQWILFNLSSFDVECVLGSDNRLGIYAFRNMIPWLCMVGFIAVAVPMKMMGKSVRYCCSGYVFLWTLFNTAIAQGVFYPLKCRSNPGGVQTNFELEGELCSNLSSWAPAIVLFTIFNVIIPMLIFGVLCWSTPEIHHTQETFRKTMRFAFTWWKPEHYFCWIMLLARGLIAALIPILFPDGGLGFLIFFTMDYMAFCYLLWYMPASDTYSNAFMVVSFSFSIAALIANNWQSEPLYEDWQKNVLTPYVMIVLFGGVAAGICTVTHMLLLAGGYIIPKRSANIMRKVHHVAHRVHEYWQFDKETTRQALVDCVQQMPNSDAWTWVTSLDVLGHTLLGDVLASSSLRGIKPKMSATAQRLSTVRLTQLSEGRGSDPLKNAQTWNKKSEGSD